jgi:hypothetical protein
LDTSGTPAALIEFARAHDDLVVLDDLTDGQVLVEFGVGPIWQEQLGYRRFVRLRRPISGCAYALVERLRT